jgi:hypothetical protein
MPSGDGYAGFSSMFALQSGDGVKWDGLGVPNPDVKRTEYVVAYMSLAARQNVLSILKGPGANGGGGICAGVADGTAGDDPYVCDSDRVEAIANAHCALAANGKPSADLMSLRRGNYADVPPGPCGAACPEECACDEQDHCVASWLGKTGDAGAADAGSALDAATGSNSSGDGGAAVDSGVAVANDAGSPSRNGGTSVSTGRNGSSDSDALDAGAAMGAAAPRHRDSGCGCNIVRGDTRRRSISALVTLGIIAFWRRRKLRS